MPSVCGVGRHGGLHHDQKNDLSLAAHPSLSSSALTTSTPPPFELSSSSPPTTTSASSSFSSSRASLCKKTSRTDDENDHFYNCGVHDCMSCSRWSASTNPCKVRRSESHCLFFCGGDFFSFLFTPLFTPPPFMRRRTRPGGIFSDMRKWSIDFSLHRNDIHASWQTHYPMISLSPSLSIYIWMNMDVWMYVSTYVWLCTCIYLFDTTPIHVYIRRKR